MRVADFSAEVGVVSVLAFQAGKPRRVALADEGRALFAALTVGRAPQDLIFRRPDGHAWGVPHQKRRPEEAAKVAKLDPPATFHIPRHSYASALAMKGVPMGVIAAQLGHSDTRMTERHYSHMSAGYVSDIIRAALPGLGIVDETSPDYARSISACRSRNAAVLARSVSWPLYNARELN